MAIFLENIELQISGKAFDKISEWINKGYVKKANEIKKNNWNYTLKSDDDIYECNLVYSEHSIKSFLCACNQRFNKKACLHVYACAQWHKLNIKSKAESQKTVKKKDLSLELVKDNLLNDNFIQFVNKELNRNERFNHAFQLRYFYLLDTLPKSIFEEILPLVQPEKTNIKRSSLISYKSQVVLLNELYEASIFCVANAMNQNGIIAALHGTLFANKLFKLFKNNQSDIINRKFHTVIYEIIRSAKQPDLREYIFGEAIQCLNNSDYNIIHAEENLAQYLISFYSQASYQKQIIKRLFNKVQNCTQDNYQSSVALMYTIANNLNNPNDLVKYFSEHQEYSWLMGIFMDDIIQSKRIHTYNVYLEKILLNHHDSINTHRVDQLLEYFIQKNDFENQLTFAILALKKLNKIKYADFLLSENVKLKQIDVLGLLGKLDKNKYTNLRLEIIQKYASSEMLINELNEQDMNEDIEHFADKLISENNHWIYDYYLNKGSDILNEFGGKPAYEKIERITKKLKTHGGDKLVDRYTKDLKSKFPERQAIFQSK
ncbi:MAG TPA: hypothetical protein PK622_06015 [Saprospiraceae bacterium]|nr:hypothetical protein [Saprospiraceae bacterium]